MSNIRGPGSELFEDIQRINIALSHEAMEIGAYNVPLLRDIPASACMGDLAKMVRFSQTGLQRYLQWRNCRAHKMRLLEVDFSDPDQTFFSPNFRASLGLSTQTAPNTTTMSADNLITKPDSPQPATTLGKRKAEVLDRGAVTDLILEAAKNGIRANDTHAVDLIKLAAAVGGTSSPSASKVPRIESAHEPSSALAQRRPSSYLPSPSPQSPCIGSAGHSKFNQQHTPESSSTYPPHPSSEGSPNFQILTPVSMVSNSTPPSSIGSTAARELAQKLAPSLSQDRASQPPNLNQPNMNLYSQLKAASLNHDPNYFRRSFNLQPVPPPRNASPVIDFEVPIPWHAGCPRPLTYEQDRKRLRALRSELKAAIKKDANLLSYRYNDWLEAFPLRDGEERNPGFDMMLANQPNPCPSDDSEYAIALRYAKKRPYYFCEVKYWKDALKYATEDGYEWESNTTRAEREGFMLRKPFDHVDTSLSCSMRGNPFEIGNWAGHVR